MNENEPMQTMSTNEITPPPVIASSAREYATTQDVEALLESKLTPVVSQLQQIFAAAEAAATVQQQAEEDSKSYDPYEDDRQIASLSLRVSRAMDEAKAKYPELEQSDLNEVIRRIEYAIESGEMTPAQVKKQLDRGAHLEAAKSLAYDRAISGKAKEKAAPPPAIGSSGVAPGGERPTSESMRIFNEYRRRNPELKKIKKRSYDALIGGGF